MAIPIVLSTPRPAPFFTPLFVAIDKGFLAEQGLEATIRYGFGREGMERGEVDFFAAPSAYQSFLEGLDVRQVCGLSTRETSHVLMIRPGIESAQQLEHVLLPGASGRQGDRFVGELRSILALNGVDLQESRIDTQHVPGSHKEQWGMLTEGIGDGATLGAPWWIIAAKEGYRNLGSEADFSPSLSGSGVHVSAERLARDPEVVRGFVEAFVKSMRYCVENLEGTLETIMKYSREWGVDGPEIARAAYDEVAPYWRVEVDTASIGEAMRKACDRMGLPPVPAERFLETRFLNDALARR